MNKTVFTFILVVFIHVVNAEPLRVDTPRVLPSLLVTGIKYPGFFAGSKFQFIEGEALNGFRQGNLGNLLSTQSQLFIKAYGSGMLSTPGMRGGNAAHTAILWNGFNLQSPMNGQADLSLIPVFLLEGVTLQYGSPSALFGSGNIGGAIHLQTESILEKGTHAALHFSGGSFGNYSAGVKVSVRTEKWLVTQKVFGQSWENQFSYRSGSLLQPGAAGAGSIQQATHASLQNRAWLQEYQWTPFPKHQLKFSSWLQECKRQLPEPGSTAPLEAEQKDEAFRNQLSYQFLDRNYELNARYGLSLESILYADLNQYPALGKTGVQTLFVDQFFRKGNFEFQFSFMEQGNEARVNQGEIWTQRRTAVFSTLKQQLFDTKFQHQFSLREEWVDGVALPLIPAYGFSFEFSGRRTLLFNASRSYRLPTFNDLYWPGMGNPNLQPELGWNQEISYKRWGRYIPVTLRGNYKQSSYYAFNTITLYNKNVENWIVWVPQGGNLSRPMNIYKVWSRGLEYSWKLMYKREKITASVTGMHDFNFVTNESSTLLNDAGLKKQILYFPVEKHRLNFQFQFQQTGFHLFYNYTGTRYVSADHSNWLDPFALWGGNVTREFAWKQMKGSLQLLLQNLTNKNYQVMVNQPMPLFNYQITLNLNI